MTDKRKRLARQLASKSGMSYQAAINALNERNRDGGDEPPTTPPADFERLVRKVARLAAAWAEVTEPRDKPLRIRDMVELAEEFLEHLQNPAPERVALINFLKTLEAPSLQRLRTLMYFGRDYHTVEERDLHGLHDHLGGSKSSAESAMGTLLEKAPHHLGNYLLEGLERAHELGFDLEAPFGERFPS